MGTGVVTIWGAADFTSSTLNLAGNAILACGGDLTFSSTTFVNLTATDIVRFVGAGAPQTVYSGGYSCPGSR